MFIKSNQHCFKWVQICANLFYLNKHKRTRAPLSMFQAFNFAFNFLSSSDIFWLFHARNFSLAISLCPLLHRIDINFSTYAFHHITKQWAMNPAAMNKCDIDKKIAWIVHCWSVIAIYNIRMKYYRSSMTKASGWIYTLFHWLHLPHTHTHTHIVPMNLCNNVLSTDSIECWLLRFVLFLPSFS